MSSSPEQVSKLKACRLYLPSWEEDCQSKKATNQGNFPCNLLNYLRMLSMQHSKSRSCPSWPSMRGQMSKGVHSRQSILLQLMVMRVVVTTWSAQSSTMAACTCARSKQETRGTKYYGLIYCIMKFSAVWSGKGLQAHDSDACLLKIWQICWEGCQERRVKLCHNESEVSKAKLCC